MAATFNAPLASVMLAVELLLFEWRPRSFLPVATPVAAATVCRSYLLGAGALFALPSMHLHLTPLVYVSCLAAGGLGGLAEPHALGVGYDVIRSLLAGRATLGLIVGILIVKTLSWALSLGSGTSGGVLAPTLMIGAALGALAGDVFPAVAPGFWALMGLAAVLGGVFRSPLTGVIFSLELTHAWAALLPLIISSSAAYGVSVLMRKRSIPDREDRPPRLSPHP
jgi:H+/Cl- antiporter ClcA